MAHIRSRLLSAAFVFFILLGCGGCQKQTPAEQIEPAVSASFHYEPGKTEVLVPRADGTVTAGTDPLTLDFSHADQGYFTGMLTGEQKKINIQVTGPDQVIYKYFLETPEVCTVFPFTAGSGSYLILAYENVGSDQYVSLFGYSLEVELENEFLPFLYPNQYVSFSENSEAVKLAAQLSKEAETDLDALNTIYQYVTRNITYDSEKAASVESGYLPDIDETLATGKGICFDYAALTVSMLRSLSIPARLEIGYSGDVRHAWVDVYIESIGWVERAVEFNGDEWKLVDPTYAAALKNDDMVREYTGDGGNYVLQYVR
ncbi:MAG: transglutaminase-like domain-containing protein [Candidatus Choladocola sp.]|nr:transglutaminase-like domain-containing protein [Candidatus Choladocola sp.]